MSPYDFQMYQKVHTGENPFPFKFCENTLSIQTNLNSQTRIHTCEKPYQCNICEKRFKSSSNHDRHMYDH